MYLPGGFGVNTGRAPTGTYMPRPELPPHLQSLFNPRPPLPFLKVPLKPKCRPYTGVVNYIDLFEEGDPPEPEYRIECFDSKYKQKQKNIEEHKKSLED